MTAPSGEVVVILNPRAGRGRAGARSSGLLRRLPRGWVVAETTAPGEAERLARAAAGQGCRLVVAAGGDGTVHEVANGLLELSGHEVALGILPVGSSNDYAASFSRQQARDPNGVCVDVGRVAAPGRRPRYFVCCLGQGLNGAVTLEAGRLRGLQGVALYGVAAVRALGRHFRHPNQRVEIDAGPPWTGPTLLLSLLLGKREGGFPMAPRAVLDDGLFEFVHAGTLSRWQVLRLLPRLALAGPPASYPNVRFGQCRQLRLESSEPLLVHADGEFFSTPADGVFSLAVELLPRRLRVVPDVRPLLTGSGSPSGR